MNNHRSHCDGLPAPVDLSAVELPGELSVLAERIAENTHNVWMRKRLGAGWRWGPARNDARRESPCIVPYGDLPESEREYDYAVAVQALKLALSLGFTIVPPSKPIR